MVTVTLDEITLNAIKAALDERLFRLETTIDYWHASQKAGPPVWDESAQRALVWNIAALHETKMAREQLSDPEVVPEHPADATFATYHDWQAAGPR